MLALKDRNVNVIYSVKSMNIILRAEKEIDKDEIFKVNQLAFNRNAEANLVNLIRDSDAEYYSCVALFNDKIIAHIMYSTVYIDNVPAGLGLAPVAVLPEYQNRGIGTKLIKFTLNELKKCNLIVVLGDDKFYSRFGFKPASNFGLKSTYDVPEQYFMAISSGNSKWQNKIVNYHPVFKTLDE